MADGLRRKFGYPILVFQGPQDRTPIAQDIRRELGDGVTLVPRLSLRKYAAVLDRSALFVTSEGGSGHIAASLGVKMIVISTTPTEFYWSPYKRWGGIVVFEELPGEDLAVEKVLSAAEALSKPRAAHGPPEPQI